MLISMEVDEAHRRAPGLGPPAAEHTDCRSLPPPRRVSPSRLHNFSFPTLNWGNQRLLRCSNLAASSEVLLLPVRKRPSSSQENPQPPPQTRELKEAGRRGGGPEGEMEESSSSAAAAAAIRPWNLRTRRAACNAPSAVTAENGRQRNGIADPGSASPLAAAKSTRLRSEGGPEREERRRKFFVSLSREEIEEDFFAFKGTKPPRRPKKRPRIVQKQLDSLFPGLWLCEITPDTYKIDEIQRM